ncbi:alpha/beta-Hydrolases superfamily protein [Actinidia rufa]|uniref:Alpha/beta-Hydrolases superfamily protein n=1 Tax=Actinidia rufa TaxID=165716 RepID=A0A7J0DZ54_9ERIC|nr:alpha/beta-Hydrolases superfamily protein [Actinidia rufa]
MHVAHIVTFLGCSSAIEVSCRVSETGIPELFSAPTKSNFALLWKINHFALVDHAVDAGPMADGNEAAVVLLPSNITVFTFDFSGSGLSDGAYVSLGWHEKDDLKVVVSYLRSNKQISCIGLWGRSMGAVTST